MSSNTVQRKSGNTNEFLIRPSEPPSVITVQAIAIVTGQSHKEMKPLTDVIDPDALDTIASESKEDIQIKFEYEDCLVTVTNNRIQVKESPSEI